MDSVNTERSVAIVWNPDDLWAMISDTNEPFLIPVVRYLDAEAASPKEEAASRTREAGRMYRADP